MKYHGIALHFCHLLLLLLFLHLLDFIFIDHSWKSEVLETCQIFLCQLSQHPIGQSMVLRSLLEHLTHEVSNLGKSCYASIAGSIRIWIEICLPIWDIVPTFLLLLTNICIQLYCFACKLDTCCCMSCSVHIDVC